MQIVCILNEWKKHDTLSWHHLGEINLYGLYIEKYIQQNVENINCGWKSWCSISLIIIV